MRFSEEQVRRYSRHIALREVGGAGQEKLLRARVGVLGAGLAPRTAALYLAGAGVGTLVLPPGEESARIALEIADLNPDVSAVLGDPAAEELVADAAGPEADAPALVLRGAEAALTALRRALGLDPRGA